jgi:predicted nucleic acid-binding protein
MESTLLGLILDSSVIIAAERKRQTVEELLALVERTFGEIEIAISAVTLAELVHGVARANTPQIRENRRAFIDELKKHIPVHPITDSTAEIAGQLSGEQAAKGITLPADDLLIGASAIEQGYAVATLNARHFQKIPGLKIFSFKESQ